MGNRATRCFVFLSVVLLAAQTHALQQEDTGDWNRFRGPNGAGISDSSDIATSWSDDENVKWKMELPGPGSSSPIVSGDKVFVTCYTGYGIDPKAPGDPGDLTRHLLCFDLNTGKELWRGNVDAVVEDDAYKGFITDHGYASSTPVTDGQHVFGFFGKSGVVAWDMNGNQLWRVSVGTKSDPAKWGGGASPMLYDDKVIVNAGIEGHALIALNQSDGSEAWRIDDESFTNNWSTPILVEVDGHTELIYSIPDKLIGINPDNGEQLWHAKSPIKNAITASVVAHEGVIYTLGGRQGQAIAVRCGGKGDVSDSHVVWTRPVPSSIGTPLVFDNHLYWLGQRNVVMCLNLEDGDEVKKQRLGPAADGDNVGSYASPVVVGDKMIILLRSGTTHIVNAGPELDTVSQSSLKSDDSLFDGTPAFADEKMIIRSDKMLYCISGK